MMIRLISLSLLLGMIPVVARSADDVTLLPRDTEKEAWVRQTFNSVGLSNQVRVVRDNSLTARTGACAFATVRNEIQWVAFDPQCVTTLKMPSNNSGATSYSREELQCIWSRGVLLHEIAHQLNAHTIAAGKSPLEADFEAEKWVGWAMGYSGAPLKEALAYAAQGPEQGGPDHHGRQTRMIAVEQGWKLSQTSASATRQGSQSAITQSPNAKSQIESLAEAARRQLRVLSGQ